MSTSIQSVSLTKVSLAYGQQYTSQGLNQHLGISRPRGVVRGFNPTPGGSALTLTLKVDELTLDSAVVLKAQSASVKEALAYHEEADVTLNLTAFAGTTVYVGVKGTYTTGAATTVEWRAYSTTEYNNGTAKEAVIMCKVVVPGSGTIATSAIDTSVRDEQWLWESHDMSGWVSLVHNTFDDTSSAAAWAVSGVSTSAFSADTAQKKFGYSSLKWDSAVASGTAQITLNDVYRVESQERVRAAVWVRKNSAATFGAGGLKIVLTVRDPAGNTDTANLTFDTTLLVTDTWVLLVADTVLPSSFTYNQMYWSFSIQLTAGVIWLDEVQLFVKPRRADKPGWLDRIGRTLAAVRGVSELIFYELGKAETTGTPFRLKRTSTTLLQLVRSAASSTFQIGDNTNNIAVDVRGTVTASGTVTAGAFSATGNVGAAAGNFTGQVSAGTDVVATDDVIAGGDFSYSATKTRTLHIPFMSFVPDKDLDDFWDWDEDTLGAYAWSTANDNTVRYAGVGIIMHSDWTITRLKLDYTRPGGVGSITVKLMRTGTVSSLVSTVSHSSAETTFSHSVADSAYYRAELQIANDTTSADVKFRGIEIDVEYTNL